MPFFFSFEQIWGAKAEIIPIEPDKVIFVRKNDTHLIIAPLILQL